MCCLVPFYNERPRIVTVLDALTKSHALSQIICVDDGSTDNGADVVAKKFPTIKIVKLPHNVGKADALRVGLKYVDTDYVFLCDADLLYLDIDALDKSIIYMTTSQTIDMLIYKIKVSPKWLSVMTKIIRGDILVSGERILKTNDLKTIFSSEKPKRYEIDFDINKYMFSHSKKCLWHDAISAQIHKTKKTGFIKGWTDDLGTMYQEVHKGIFDWLRMVLFFCTEQYKINESESLKITQ